MKVSNLLQFGMMVLIIASTGCASIVSKSKWPVTFKSEPSGAEVVIADDKGQEIYRGVTPVTFKLRSGQSFFQSNDYQVDMRLAGYEEDKNVLKSSLNGWYFGNIVFGGLIGLVIVDPITGAMWRLPTEYNVNLNSSSASQK
jgi:hypothetical protein